jgi:hypothetical protein
MVVGARIIVPVIQLTPVFDHPSLLRKEGNLQFLPVISSPPSFPEREGGGGMSYHSNL